MAQSAGRLAAAVSVLIAVLSISALAETEPAAAQNVPSYTGASPGFGSVGLLVTARSATAPELIRDLRAAGCEPVSLAVLFGGSWGLYLEGAPTSVNATFPGVLQETTPFFVRCSTSPPRAGVAGPPPAATPFPSSTPVVVPTVAPTTPYTLFTPYTAYVVNAASTGFVASVTGEPLVPASIDCDFNAGTLSWGLPDGAAVQVVASGTGRCVGWYLLYSLESDESYWMPTIHLSATPAVSAPPPVYIPPIIPSEEFETVSVVSVLDSYEVVVARRNGEMWLLEYGIGCLGLLLREGRMVVIQSPGLFAGIGSYILIPDRDQSCRIWDSELLR